MTPWWIVAVTAVVYGCAAFLGIQASAAICDKVAPFEDGPRPGKPPVLLLVVGTVLIGGMLASRGFAVPYLGLLAVICVSLAACTYSDVRCGIVPDYFTLLPLAIVLGITALGHDFVPLFSAAVVFVPFAAAALLSKGRGMGWGDVKLVALGGAVLAPLTAILALAAACIAAVCVAWFRGRKTEPIAFAPYIAGSIAVSLAFFNPFS